MRIDVNNNERSCLKHTSKNQFGMLEHSYYGSTILQFKSYKNVYYAKRYGKVRYFLGRTGFYGIFDAIFLMRNVGKS